MLSSYKHLLKYVKIGSVEEFQGQEKNVIIVTTTRCTTQPWNKVGQNLIGFLDDENVSLNHFIYNYDLNSSNEILSVNWLLTQNNFRRCKC